MVHYFYNDVSFNGLLVSSTFLYFCLNSVVHYGINVFDLQVLGISERCHGLGGDGGGGGEQEARPKIIIYSRKWS